MSVNPYALTQPKPKQACREYLVRISRLPAWEYARVAGRPVMGRFVWLLGKVGWIDLDTLVIPATQPLVDEVCERSSVDSAVMNLIEPSLHEAYSLGFIEEVWSGWVDAERDSASFAVRMLHPDRKYFLQMVASVANGFGGAEAHLVSYAESGAQATCSFATSNFHRKFQLPPKTIAKYVPDATILELLNTHRREYGHRFEHFKAVECFEDIAFIVDLVGKRFADQMIQRGIWVEQ